MPELPEVETIVRDLREPLVGQTIVDVRNDWPRLIALPDLAELRARIGGRIIEAINRRGKYLVFNLDGGETLIIHLKMSGQLSVVAATEPADPYVHTAFVLASGEELRFHDVRKFGRVYLVRDPGLVLGDLGPEPLSAAFNPDWLVDQLQQRRRVIKSLLLDQTFIAGVGNIYADEALFLAGINPGRRSDSLTAAEARALHAAIRRVLKLGIARNGASIDGAYRRPDGSSGDMQLEFAVYGRAEEPCIRCPGIVQRIVLGGRSTHYCNACQF